MAWNPPDDSVLSSDGAGALTVASLTASGDVATATVTASSTVEAAAFVGTGVRAVAADTAAITLTDADHFVTFSTTGAGSNTIAASALTPGKVIHLCATAISTGTYTLAATEGTLTFDAANEMATVIAITASTFRVISLQGATIV